MFDQYRESDQSPGIFNREEVGQALRDGSISRMTCRWCRGEMKLTKSDGGIATIGLVCPTCDASPARRQPVQ